jgi:hypothetical protein
VDKNLARLDVVHVPATAEEKEEKSSEKDRDA